MGTLSSRDVGSEFDGEEFAEGRGGVRARGRAPFHVFFLGRVSYGEMAGLQGRLGYELGESGGPAASLALCEHPPTLTVGRLGSRAHIVEDDADLRRLGYGAPLWVRRGGGVFAHGPGRLEAYLIADLDRLGLSVPGYLSRLAGAVVDTLAEFDLRATVRDDPPGVYLDHARVAALGISVSRGVTSHGVTLNVGASPFREPEIVEPGPNGWALATTSMEARRRNPAPGNRVREALARNVERRFRLERVCVQSHHPSLRPRPLPSTSRPHAS